jgi:AcrR family transcriptional regulator
MKKRLSKEARRKQLLSLAESIVTAEGADALTLITLAEKAGVTKALTYEHFSNREGLLVELYKHYDSQVITETQAAIASSPPTLESAAHAAATSYIKCASQYGVQYEAVVSALLAYPEYKDIRLDMREFFVNAYKKLFSSFLTTSENDSRLKLIAVFGAIEEVARSVSVKEFRVDEAVESLAKIIISILKGA